MALHASLLRANRGCALTSHLREIRVWTDRLLGHVATIDSEPGRTGRKEGL